MKNNIVNTDCCILLSTCDKYVGLAILTVDLIHKRWIDHPKIFVCGVSHTFPGVTETLVLVNDAMDWIGITETAVNELIKKGFRKCYFILEDHPPLQVCNDLHLNITLPALMDELGAAYIGLYGWDQNTLSNGIILSAEFYRLQHQETSFLWQYSLHPALWNLDAFIATLRSLPEINNDITSRSAWAFERRAGIPETPASVKWRGMSYRIFGLGMLGGRFRPARRFIRQLMFLTIDLMSMIIKWIFGSDNRESFVNFFLPETLFFDGPYPLFWSGVMQKGALNKHFEKFLVRHRRNNELSNFRAALKNKI
jgi:hypothetical protein